MKDEELRKVVSAKYAKAAQAARAGEQASCCEPTCCGGDVERAKVQGVEPKAEKGGCCGPSCCWSESLGVDPITRDLYDNMEKGQLPQEAISASLGCGNPTALAKLSPGEVVLDLGSGGGIDVLLSARRVGPTGKAYGLDMTDEM